MSVRVYPIHNPSGFRVLLAIATALTIFLFSFGYLTGKAAPLGLMVLCLTFLPLAYVLHLGNRSVFTIADEKREITFVPSLYVRFFSRAKQQLADFTNDSELVFCRHSSYGFFDGFRILLRTPNLPDRLLWQSWNHSSGVTRKWWAHLAIEISSEHRLKVILRTVAITSHGSEEKDWAPIGQAAIRRTLALALPAVLAPWFGILIRILTERVMIIMLAGLLLWAAGWLLPLLVMRSSGMFEGKGRPREIIMPLFLWSVQFTAFFAISVLVTGAFLGH